MLLLREHDCTGRETAKINRERERERLGRVELTLAAAQNTPASSWDRLNKFTVEVAG